MPFRESCSTPTVGTAVKNQAGEDFGSLSEIIFDPATGRLRFAVVALKSDSTLVVIPWRAVTFRPGEPLVVNADTEELKKAPKLHADEGADLTELRWGGEPSQPVGREVQYGDIYDRVLSARTERARSAASHVGRAARIVGALVLVAGFVFLLSSPPKSLITGQDMHRVEAALKETSAAVKQTSMDAATTVKVKTALALSTRIPAGDVKVDTRHAVATLIGQVPSTETRDAAGQIAADTPGVREVRNLLTVAPGDAH